MRLSPPTGPEARSDGHRWRGAPPDVRLEFFHSLRKSMYTYLSAPCVDNEWTGQQF